MAAIAEVSEGWGGLEFADAASMEAGAVLARLGTSESGLAESEASRRLQALGPNAILSHGAQPLRVLLRQLRNPLLILLAGAALVSILVGERADALIILVIVCLSVGLGFVNEYRSEKAVEELHSSIRHTAVTTRVPGSAPWMSPSSSPATWSAWTSERSSPPTSGCSRRTASSATRPCSPGSRCPPRREPSPSRGRTLPWTWPHVRSWARWSGPARGEGWS